MRMPSRLAPVAALVLAACTAPSPEKTAPTPDPGKPPVQEAPPQATPPKEAPTEPPAPAAKLLGEPFERAGDVAKQVDALTVWGWSKDGRYFAFETNYGGPGATTCEGELDLFIVDADTDTFAEGGRLTIKHKNPEAARCDPPDLKAAMAAQRPDILKKYDIEPGHLTAPVEFVAAGGEPPALKRYTLALPAGGSATAELTVLFGGRDAVLDKNNKPQGAAFRLTLQRDKEEPVTLEKGERRRPFVWDYDLGKGLAFFSPDRKHAAVLTATIQLSFEGDRTSYMASGFRLPPGW